MRSRNRLTAAAVVLALLASATTSASAQTWAGWSFYWENDTWVPGSLGSDDAFTNGIRFVFGRDSGANLRGAGLWVRAFPRTRNYDVTSALILGQNFFTPRSITETSPDATDRPYAGFSYLGWRYDATSRLTIEGGVPASKQHQMQHSLELNLGVLGQGAAARLFQAGTHSVITTHRIPRGWSSQIQNSIGASAFYLGRSRWGYGPVDATLHWGGMLGTTQIYPVLGTTLRLGHGMSGFPALLVRNTAVAPQARHPVEVGVAASAEGRYMAYNAFVEGSVTSREAPGIDPDRRVGSYSVSLFLRILDARLDYSFVRRSPEVKQVGPSEGTFDNYGSIALSYEPGSEVLGTEWLQEFLSEDLPTAFSGFYLEGGFGSEIGADEPGTVRTSAMHVALGRRLWKHLDVGWERAGVGREFVEAPLPSGDYRTRMLYGSVFTLRYRPLGGRYKWFDFHVRGGTGGEVLSGGTNETELTPALPGPRVTPCPSGFELLPPGNVRDKSYCNRYEQGTATLFGGGLSVRPWQNEELGLNLDVFRMDVGAGDESAFAAWSLGIRWTPN